MIDASIIQAAKSGVKRVNRAPKKDKEIVDGVFDLPPVLSKLKNRTTESLLQEYSDIMEQQSKLNQ